MRWHARNQNISLAILLLAIQREQGNSQEDAATFAVNKFGLAIEPETLVRKARSVTNVFVKRVSDWHSSASAADTAKLYLRRNRKNKRVVNPGTGH